MWNDDQVQPAVSPVGQPARPSMAPSGGEVAVGVGLVALGMLTIVGSAGLSG